jgi:hypothetical protein
MSFFSGSRYVLLRVVAKYWLGTRTSGWNRENTLSSTLALRKAGPGENSFRMRRENGALCF